MPRGCPTIDLITQHDNDPLRKIERLNWTLAAVSRVNSAPVRASTEHELYRAICEALTFQDIFALGSNRLAIRLQPNEGIVMRMVSEHLIEKHGIRWYV